MESFRAFFNRFVRLLPFLTAPYFSRFHHELFFPYPDVWNSSEDAPSIPDVRGAVASTGRKALSEAGVGRARMPHHPVGQHARPYLRWIEMNSWGHHGGEPFW